MNQTGKLRDEVFSNNENKSPKTPVQNTAETTKPKTPELSVSKRTQPEVPPDAGKRYVEIRPKRNSTSSDTANNPVAENRIVTTENSRLSTQPTSSEKKRSKTKSSIKSSKTTVTSKKTLDFFMVSITFSKKGKSRLRQTFGEGQKENEESLESVGTTGNGQPNAVDSAEKSLWMEKLKGAYSVYFDRAKQQKKNSSKKEKRNKTKIIKDGTSEPDLPLSGSQSGSESESESGSEYESEPEPKPEKETKKKDIKPFFNITDSPKDINMNVFTQNSYREQSDLSPFRKDEKVTRGGATAKKARTPDKNPKPKDQGSEARRVSSNLQRIDSGTGNIDSGTGNINFITPNKGSNAPNKESNTPSKGFNAPSKKFNTPSKVSNTPSKGSNTPSKKPNIQPTKPNSQSRESNSNPTEPNPRAGQPNKQVREFGTVPPRPEDYTTLEMLVAHILIDMNSIHLEKKREKRRRRRNMLNLGYLQKCLVEMKDTPALTVNPNQEASSNGQKNENVALQQIPLSTQEERACVCPCPLHKQNRQQLPGSAILQDPKNQNRILKSSQKKKKQVSFHLASAKLPTDSENPGTITSTQLPDSNNSIKSVLKNTNYLQPGSMPNNNEASS